VYDETAYRRDVSGATDRGMAGAAGPFVAGKNASHMQEPPVQNYYHRNSFNETPNLPPA
jgi:hypothetical protein